MRALFVAPYLPTHGSGGRTRLINLMQRLGKDHELRLVGFTASDQDPSQNPYPGIGVPPPPLPSRTGLRGRIGFYAQRLDRLPLFAAALRSSEMTSAIAGTVERFRPDVVQFETTEMGQYLSAARGTARALDLQDVSSRWLGRVVGHGRTVQQRALMRLELAKTRRFERAIARAPDAVFVTSPVERSFLRDLSGVDAVEVPNGVDTGSFVPMDVPETSNAILFVGPLTSEANLDAVRWFARDILPLVRTEVPDATLDVVGAPVDERFGAGVRLRGRVEDVREWLARAPLSVVPIRVASGTRYKILEALSMMRAVVSTPAGAEGLGTRDGEHVRIADDAEGFARAVVDLLRDPAERARLGRAGREHVVARYDWGILCARIEEAWVAAAERRRR